MKFNFFQGGELQFDKREVFTRRQISPFQILHLSDIHLTKGDEPYLEDLSKKIQGIKDQIDIVTIGGDLINDNSGIQLLQDFSKVLPKVPMICILGNHDTSGTPPHYIPIKKQFKLWKSRLKRVDTQLLRETLQKLNIHLLENKSFELSLPQQKVFVYGIAQPFYGMPFQHPQLSETEATSPHFKLLLVHKPDVKPSHVKDFDLLLGGHTHGGQVRLPILGAITSNCRVKPSQASGHYRINDCQWIVNNGFSGGSRYIRFRYGAPRQISQIKVSTGPIQNLEEIQLI